MSEKENVELLRHAYALWHDSKADSVGHWLSLIADDVQWRSLAGGASGMEFTRNQVGKAAVAQYFAELGSQWAMNHYTVDEFIAQGDRVVMLGRCSWRNKKTGATVDTPKVDILTIKDARIVDFFELYDTAQALTAAGGMVAAKAPKPRRKQAAKGKRRTARKARKAAKRAPPKRRKKKR